MANGLIDFASFNPAGAFAGGLESGSKLVGGIQDSIARREEQERLDRAMALLGRSVGSELAGLSPEMFAAEQQFTANQAMADQAEQQRMLESVARDAKTALDIKDPSQRNQFLQRRVESIFNSGGDPSDTIDLMKLPFEQQTFELQDALNAIAPASELFDDGLEQQKLALRERELEQRAKSAELDIAKEERAAGKLSAGLEKALLTAQDRTVEAQRNSNEFEVLAGDFDRRKIEGGLASTFTETLKGILGTQDDVSEFKRRFNKVRLSEGLKNLPPGPATDRDVQEAFKGVPKDNASPEQVASFLRGAARLARFEAGFNQFKSDFISEKRTAAGLNKEWRKQVDSPVLKRKVSIAEIYETAQNRGVTPEEIKAQLGIE